MAIKTVNEFISIKLQKYQGTLKNEEKDLLWALWHATSDI